jgi:hypothetical protein
MTTLIQQTVPVHDDELAGRLAEHLVAGALVRKSAADPVPFPVWWRVTDALRATVLESPADALPDVDAAIAGLLGAVQGLSTSSPALVPAHQDEPRQALRRAQVLVARLVFATAPTPPTLLHVRLARLRRALVATTAGSHAAG